MISILLIYFISYLQLLYHFFSLFKYINFNSLLDIDRKDTVTTRSLCVESNKLVNSEHLDRGSTDISMITCSSFDIVAEECIGKCSENSCCTNVDLLFQTASRLSNRKVKNRFRELELAWRNGMHE